MFILEIIMELLYEFIKEIFMQIFEAIFSTDKSRKAHEKREQRSEARKKKSMDKLYSKLHKKIEQKTGIKVFEIFCFGVASIGGMLIRFILVSIFISIPLVSWMIPRNVWIYIAIYSIFIILCMLSLLYIRSIQKFLILYDDSFHFLRGNDYKCCELKKIIFNERGLEIVFKDNQVKNITLAHDDFDDFNKVTYDELKKTIMESGNTLYDNSYFENKSNSKSKSLDY